MARCSSAARPVPPIDAGRVGQSAGEVGGNGVVAGDRFGLDAELLGLRQARWACRESRIARTASSGSTRWRPGPDAAPRRRRSGATHRSSTVSESPGCGMNGQNSRTPHSASSGGSTSSENTAATTRPVAACTPRLRVLGADANSRVSSASTTVALLATIAGPAVRTAVCSAARWSRRSSPQLLAVARNQQQRIVGARPEHQHAGDAGRRTVRGQAGRDVRAAPATAPTRSANAITSSGTSHSTGER